MTKNKQIRVGMIGPKDSLQIIEKIAASFPEATWSFWEYEDVNDAPKLVEAHAGDVDVFLFSGEVPFQIVQNSEYEGTKPLLYIPHTGVALYRSLFDMALHHQKSLQRVSVDTLAEQDVRDVYQELGVPFSEVHVRSLETSGTDSEEWGRFHLRLWKEGKVDTALTTMRSVYRFLQQHDVPVFRIRPTESIIRECLEKAVRIGMLQYAQKGQILIQLITIDRFGDLVAHLGSEYEAQKVQLELYKRLLDYAQEIEGSFTSLGKDLFLLVTTQGAYQRYTDGKLTNPIPEWVLEHLPVHISVGIGVGQTGIEAETHARIALKYAQESGGGCCFLVTAAGEVNGPLDHDSPLSFAYQIDERLLAIAKQAGVSPATFGKVKHVMEKLERTELSAAELAQHLKITPRASRRILTNLENAGVARRIGEESPSSSGRPRAIFKIDL
ncbi:hypothetical protein EDM56_11535 [Brevibacillus fluminis]|uniref:Uncharacterized protein n=1 Tax=Brevibacillus fluminis TaxID=511487 RepID=A0A3M8DQR8_9BACL|nr:hypothetical protein [Brevibacillus fluminis]RNB89791.1 hypothetical protein EDM56_11535 [Brevibacillus fluminis]